jgi:DNA-binding transcriptional LysR family regulator
MMAVTADALRANDLTVQQLSSFCLVFERQSYSVAAKELGLSVPTVWDQVQSLARRYDTLLFEKRGRRIFPTPSAEVLHEALGPLLAGVDSTFDLVREGKAQGPALTIVVGVRMMLEELGPPLKRFRDRQPRGRATADPR